MDNSDNALPRICLFREQRAFHNLPTQVVEKLRGGVFCAILSFSLASWPLVLFVFAGDLATQNLNSSGQFTTHADFNCRNRSAGGAYIALSAMCAAGVGKKMKMMKAIEAARAGHEGIHRPGFAHMPNNGMYAPPADILSLDTTVNGG